MMASGSAVQTNGLGLALVSCRKRLMAAWRSATPLYTPRLSRRRASLAKKPSTALSQEAEVGVKWKWNRLWRPSQSRTLGCLCVQRDEQGGGAVALVVMGHGATTAALHRQPRLGAVERLDLALLIDRQHQRMLGRVDIEADNILNLSGKRGIVGQLELPDPMRLQTARCPDPLHAAEADASGLGNRPPGPMRCLARGIGRRHRDDPLDRRAWQRFLAPRSRCVV